MNEIDKNNVDQIMAVLHKELVIGAAISRLIKANGEQLTPLDERHVGQLIEDGRHLEAINYVKGLHRRGKHKSMSSQVTSATLGYNAPGDKRIKIFAGKGMYKISGGLPSLGKRK